mmetsp:Transcript_41247/g.86141  ORF Transcript_41247/g.86141 Transcript_41247/m.86141 type:complete len:262 (+) Transcript_41247:994-1779(+)
MFPSDGGEGGAGACAVRTDPSAQPGMMPCTALACRSLFASSSALTAAMNDAGAGAEKKGRADHSDSPLSSVWGEAVTSGQRSSAIRRSEPPILPPYGAGHSCHGWNESSSPAWFSANTRSMLPGKERGGRLTTGGDTFAGGWATPSAVASVAAPARPCPQSKLSAQEAARPKAFRRRAGGNLCGWPDAPSMRPSTDLLRAAVVDEACLVSAAGSFWRGRSEDGTVPTYHRWPPLLERHSLWRHRRKICPIPFTVIWAPLLT